MTYLMIDFGKRINEQEQGTKLAFDMLSKKAEFPHILDFKEVEVVTTAFFNAMISELIKGGINVKEIDLSFKISGVNEAIKNNLLISLELAKYYE